MREIPTFNPKALYPILGTAMPRSRIDDDTRMPDLLIPCDGDAEAGQAHVERRFLTALLESPAHWRDDVVRHIEVAGAPGRTGAQQAPVFYITFNPRVRLRIVTVQTFAWDASDPALGVSASDDVRAQVLAIDPGPGLEAHPWHTCGAAAGERVVRLCEEAGFDLSPSGRKQYWPGRELTPIADYLPHRFMVKLAYARYAIARLAARDARAAH